LLTQLLWCPYKPRNLSVVFPGYSHLSHYNKNRGKVRYACYCSYLSIML
jgi:hypothetical protein